MGRNTTPELRRLSIDRMDYGMKVREISRSLDIPKITAGDIINTFKDEDMIFAKKPGRKPKTTARSSKQLISLSTRKPTLTSLQHADTLVDGNLYSTRSIRRNLNHAGLHGRVPAREFGKFGNGLAKVYIQTKCN